MEAEHEFCLFLSFLGAFSHRFLELFVFYDYIVVVGKFSYSCGQLNGISEIDQQYAEEQSDNKGEGEIVRQPVECTENIRMYKEIIDRAEDRPEERKFRADYAAYIAPFVGVVPQFYFHTFDKNNSGYVFNNGHGDRHCGEKHDPIQNDVFYC